MQLAYWRASWVLQHQAQRRMQLMQLRPLREEHAQRASAARS